MQGFQLVQFATIPIIYHMANTSCSYFLVSDTFTVGSRISYLNVVESSKYNFSDDCVIGYNS